MVRCHVRGSVEPLLKVLASAGVTRLLSREPSLEELFLAQYGGDDRPDEPDQLPAELAVRRQRPSSVVVRLAPSLPA